MASRFIPWSKHGRRSSESMRNGGPTPRTPDGSLESEEDMNLHKRRPPPLRLIMPKDTKELNCLTPSSIVFHDSGLGSATHLALAANEAVAAVDKLLGPPTKDTSAGSETKGTTLLPELPASFVPLRYPSELPAELPGSLLMQDEGFSPNSLTRWGRGPEKFPRAVAISLASESPATPSRKLSQEQAESPNSSNAGSMSSTSIYASAVEGNASAFKSPLPPSSPSSWLDHGLPAGAKKTIIEGMCEGKTATQQVNQVFARLIQAHEATLRDRDDSIANLTTQVQTLQAAHESAVTSLQNNHAAEIEFLRSLISEFEKSKISHESYQHHLTPTTEDIKSSALDSSSLCVDSTAKAMDKDYLIAQLRSLGDSEPVQLRNRKLREQVRSLVNSDTAKTMDKDYLIAQLRSLGDSELVQDRDRELEEQIRSLSNAEHVPDSKRELREQVQAAQTQEEDLCTKIAGLEIKLAESQDELAHYKQYTTELHSTLDKKNDKILDLDLDLGDARSELNELREQNRFLSEVQREAEENDSRLAAVAKDNRELKIALKLKNTCIDELRYESYQKEEELMALRHKLAASEDQVNKLQNQVITNPVDITLSYSAQASPNAGPPSAGSDSSGIGPNQHDAYIVTKDPFRAPTQDPHARMMELKAEIKLHLEDIKLYKLDVRGYKKDVKALKKGIQFRDDKIEELNQKIEEYKDAFIGLNNAYAWGTQAPPPPPPPRTSSPTTSQQGYHPSSPVGLGIDVLAPAPLRTRPKAPLQPSPGPWCPVISSNPQHETPLSKFNAAYDSSPTPPLITTMQGTYHGSPVTMSRKSQYPKSHTSKSHTPKMPIITEQ